MQMQISKLAWGKTVAVVTNTVGAVAIIFVNKHVISAHGFSYVATLTTLHFIATALFSMNIAARSVRTFDLAWFTLATDASVIFMNLSLSINSVGIYQISKILLLPTNCIFEVLLFGRRFSFVATMSIATVMFGVSIATVSDVYVHAAGLLAVGSAVLCSALHQVGVALLRKTYSLGSAELLSSTAPSQAISMLLVGPIVDRFVTGNWSWTWFLTCSSEALFWVLLSMALAVCINASQVFCIGYFSPAGAQVLGHLKTVIVLSIAWIFYEPSGSSRMNQFVGAAIAMAGISSFVICTQQSALQTQLSESQLTSKTAEDQVQSVAGKTVKGSTLTTDA